MLARLAFALALVAVGTPAVAQTLYPSPEAAARRCRSPVVWLNTKTHIYHLQGSKDFGMTKNGAYACQKAADKAGDRPAMNGQ